MNTPHSILIIEDDDFLRTLASNKLTSVGFSVSVASEGVSGLAKIESGNYDIVILDLLLPGMDGFHILAKLKNSGVLEKQTIIVFSNLGTPEDIKNITEYGIKHYMIKSSFTLDELVMRINEILSEKSGTPIATTVTKPADIEFTAEENDANDVPHSPVV